MANKDDYLTYYREFFEKFAQTVNPNDQLPVKLASYKLVNTEVVGGIIDWTTQYLTQKNCPLHLLAPLIKIVIEEIRKACKKHPVSCGFNPADNAYEPLKLMQTVMAKTNEVCLRYLDNSMLYSLPSPGSPYFITSAWAIKNTRRRMEDRHVIIHDLNTMFNVQEASPSSYYAVFDGHAGHDAAAYSSAHLHQFLAENKYFASNPEQALLEAFCKTDTLFIDKCKVENLTSGTTAVVALLRPKEKTLYIAWVGDSQALLVNQGRMLQIVNPHKPSRQDERERIEKQGGCVLLWGIWRVNGQLAVSRAIGDAEYKPHVIAIPDIREIPLDGGEDFLILACDGLWDFLSEDCAARAVYCLVTENPDDTDRIAPHLAQLSREQGSSDNISVIVVFLREPSKIAAEAHWANRNCTSVTMDASLDNANNPFAISNGATTDNILSQKSEGLLLNLTDNFKQNGTDLSPGSDFYEKEKSNGKRSASEFDDDDFGPETNVDTVDDILSPVETAKGFGDVFGNNNPAEGVYNPFMEHQEKAALEIQRELQKQESSDYEEPRLAREETPTPPADAVHDVSGLVDNVAESDSEDEWNYYKGDEANKENISPQPDKEVAEVPEEEDNMSQLNPNAAEFVPVSPTRSIPSPACRTLINDEVIAQSPIRPTNELDINLPNPVEFEKEVKSRPSEVDSYSNGHNSDSDHNTTPTDLMEKVLNGKNIDEIPEFQPGSTPTKITPSEEFHFGPNAAPFTPAKLLDQSETGLSTRAVYGDESVATLGTSFNESVTSQDTAADLNLLNKESDPMSMSFYADKEDSNPFDLNKVHVLPDNIEEFLKKSDNSMFNDTISDLPEHNPLGESEKISDTTLNNDDAIQTTDLDKQSYDDEKELASPLDPEKDLIAGIEECDFSKTPEPTHENLLGEDFCHIPEKPKTPEIDSLARDVELISPEPTGHSSEPISPRPESSHDEIVETKSTLLEATEVSDLLQTDQADLPRDVELISPDLIEKLSESSSSRPSSSHEKISEINLSYLPEAEANAFLQQEIWPPGAQLSSLIESSENLVKAPQLVAEEVTDLRQDDIEVLESKSPLTEATEVSDLLETLQSETFILKSPLPEANDIHNLLNVEADIAESKLPLPETNDTLNLLHAESKSPLLEATDNLQPTKTEVFETQSPIPEAPASEVFESKSPISERLGVESPVCHLPESKSPVCNLPESTSPVSDLVEPKSPVCDLPESVSPLCDLPESKSPVCERPDIESKSPMYDVFETKSPVCERLDVKSPEITASELLVCDFTESKSPVPEYIDEICSLQRDVTSPLIKEDVSPVPPQEEMYDFTKSELIEQADQHFNEICKPKDTNIIESPHEDIISSLKDEELSSPAKSPLNQIIEDSFTDEHSTLISGIAQDIRDVIQESVMQAASFITKEHVTSESCPISFSKTIADTESVATTDINSFLECSLPPGVTSPLGPAKQEIDNMKECVYPVGDNLDEHSVEQIIPATLDLNHPLSECVFPLPTEAGEQIDIKTENISPEYAEQAIVTPSEESKNEDVPTAPLIEEPVKELVVEEKKLEEQNESAPVVAAIATAGVAVATAAAVTSIVAKAEDKKKAGTAPAKKPAGPHKSAITPKTTSKSPAPPKATSRLSTSKVSPAKTGPAKPSMTVAPKPATTRPSPRPKTTAAPKPADKKPLTNGDIKSTVRSSLTARKTPSESPATKTTASRPATATPKLSPTKPTAPRSAAPRPTTVPKTTTRPATTTTSSIAARPRPTTLAHKSTGAVTGSAVTGSAVTGSTTTTKATTTTTKTPLTKTSPKTATAPKPKPPVSTTLSKPRVPLTKTVSKAPDTEKQNKESANKLTASRSVTSTTRTASAAARTTSSNIRKVESKTSGTRTTVSKTTTTTMKSTTAKKPAEIVRNVSSKTKTTKIEKPKENGISTVVTEEITVVNNTSSVIDSEPQLLKDNSPVDNKLILENSLVQTNIAD